MIKTYTYWVSSKSLPFLTTFLTRKQGRPWELLSRSMMCCMEIPEVFPLHSAVEVVSPRCIIHLLGVVQLSRWIQASIGAIWSCWKGWLHKLSEFHEITMQHCDFDCFAAIFRWREKCTIRDMTMQVHTDWAIFFHSDGSQLHQLPCFGRRCCSSGRWIALRCGSFIFRMGRFCAFPKSFMGGLLEKTNQIWSAFRFSRRDLCWCGWKCNAQVENAIVAFQSQTSPCHGGDKHWKLDSIRGSWYQRFNQSISSTEGCSSGVAFDIQDNRLPSKSYSNGRFCPRWSVGSGVLECMLLLT